MKYLAIAAVFAASAAHAEMTADTTRYTCERGVEIPVTYVNADEESVAVLNVEGGQITLWVEQSASGARYGWPSDGSSYVWWTKGDTATLAWKDGESGEEVTLLAECARQ